MQTEKIPLNPKSIILLQSSHKNLRSGKKTERNGKYGQKIYGRIHQQKLLHFKQGIESIQNNNRIFFHQILLFIVIGDIHGQFFDLLNIFDKYSMKSFKILFLGDYVDRGQFCIEVITLLMVLKIQHPNSVHLLRGNHESKNMTSEYNFKLQCCKKYSIQIYQRVLDWFKVLPLAAVIDAELLKIKRNIEIPQHGVMCDLLWSDPTEDDDSQWEKNETRGVSYFFRRTIASKFLKQHNFKMIIRAHELQDKGFKFQESPGNKRKDEKPQTYSLALFSAPNYCDKFDNKGAIAIIKNEKIIIETFTQVPHSVVLPGYMDVFEWTLPFIIVCIDHMMKQMFRQKTKKRSSIQPLKQIVTEMQQYSSLQFIRELFEKVMVQKNQSFPIRRTEEMKNSQPIERGISTEKKQNFHVPGPFYIKFSKIKPKFLKSVYQQKKSLKSSSSDSLGENIMNY